MRIAVAGSGELALSMLKPLLDSGHEIVALIQDGRKCKGLSRRMSPILDRFLHGKANVLALAQRRRIPLVWIDTMSEEELASLRALEPDLILVGGFGIIFKAPLLELPRIACINVHSSLLPKHRGPNPFSRVILANEAESGITFHVMEEEIDSGDILEQASFALGEHYTAWDVYNMACTLTETCVRGMVDRVASEGVQGRPQDAEAATYEPLLREEDAVINWADTAEDIDRQIRACHPFVKTCFRFRDATLQVTKADFDTTPVLERPGTVLVVRPSFVVATGHGTLVLEGGDYGTRVGQLGIEPGVRLE